MKQILFLLLSLITINARSQSTKFVEAWNFVERYCVKIDSACDVIKTQKVSCNKIKSNVKVFSAHHRQIKHKIRSTYRSGQNIVTHTYSFGREKTIKVIEVNGRLMTINVRWYKAKPAEDVTSQFVRLGDTKWIWTYKKRMAVFDNGVENKYPITEVIETTDNWPQ